MWDVLYRFRIFPNEAQRVQIQKTFDACSFVYSYFYKLEREVYQGSGMRLTLRDRLPLLAELKQDDKYPELREVAASALTLVIEDISRNRFQEGKPYSNAHSVLNKNNIFIGNGFIQLPRLGNIEAKLPNVIEGEIYSATIEMSHKGEYTLGLFCRNVRG